jgi:hypothetical protein
MSGIMGEAVRAVATKLYSLAASFWVIVKVKEKEELKDA